MSNYNSLKTTINANVKQNGNQEITGQILNSVLNQMVNTLGAGYQFAGVATTATTPGSPDAKVFYIANGKGTYTNFGGLQVTEDDVVVLYWDSAWHKVSTGIASQAKLSELEGKEDKVEKVVGIKEKETTESVALIIRSGYYTLAGAFVEETGRQSALLIVNEGEKYLVTTTTRPASIAGIIFFDAEDGVISYDLRGKGVNESFADYEVIIPSNCVKMAIQAPDPTSVSPIGLKKVSFVKDGLLQNSISTRRTNYIPLGTNVLGNSFSTIGAGWSLSNGIYTHISGQTEPLEILADTEIGERYIAIFKTTIGGYAEEALSVSIGDGVICDTYNGTTEHIVGFISDGGHLKFTPSSSFVGGVLNITLHKIVAEDSASFILPYSVDNVVNNAVNNDVSGWWNIVIGASDTMSKNQNGSRNIAIGEHCMANLEGGERNIGLGTFVFNQLKEGHRNIGIGADALYRTTKSNDNVAIGKASMGKTHTSPADHTYLKNVAVGNNTIQGENPSIQFNVAIGHEAMAFLPTFPTAQFNTCVGYQAGAKAYNNNTCVGSQAGYWANGGQNNTMIGASAGKNITSGNNNVLIGEGAKAKTSGAYSNSVAIGRNAEITKSNQVVIGTTTQTEFVVLGNKKLNFNADGTVTWEQI